MVSIRSEGAAHEWRIRRVRGSAGNDAGRPYCAVYRRCVLGLGHVSLSPPQATRPDIANPCSGCGYADTGSERIKRNCRSLAEAVALINVSRSVQPPPEALETFRCRVRMPRTGYPNAITAPLNDHEVAAAVEAILPPARLAYRVTGTLCLPPHTLLMCRCRHGTSL